MTLSPARQLRDLLARPGIIRSMGAHDVLSALVFEKAGFEMLFIGGFGTSASLFGLPDLNFLGIAEMADALRRMAARVGIPVVADGDTGHGDVHNVVRCVEEFAGAGAAGVILEDQAAPKRCGHFEDKSLISPDEMVLKIKAAAHARARHLDPDFVIVARTDARAAEGLDAAIARVCSYCEAGADVAFIEAPLSEDEIERVGTEVPAPKLINMLSFGKTPILDAGRLEELGYKIVVSPIDSVLVTVHALRELAATFLRDGESTALADRMVSFDAVKSLLGVDQYLALRETLSSDG